MGGMKKIGNWNGARALVNSLASDLDKACAISAKRFGLIAEGIAKEHISKQDLGWEPLSEDYRNQKIGKYGRTRKDGGRDKRFKKQRSENILVASSTYFQSITSWADTYGRGYTGYAGVDKKVTYSGNDGNMRVADIARIHEYGNDKTPARPLWQPTFKEAFEKWKATSTPIHFFKKSKNL